MLIIGCDYRPSVQQIAWAERLPLDWEQALSVWVVASIILLLVIWAFKLLPRILFR